MQTAAIVVGLLLIAFIIARAIGTKKERLLRRRLERQHRRFHRHLLEGRYDKGAKSTSDSPDDPEMAPSVTTSMKPVLHSFAYALDHLREQVSEIAPADMVAQPGGIVNHPAWVIGHLTYTCQMLGGAIGLPPWLPDDWASRFGPGSQPVADITHYETEDDAMATLQDAERRIAEAVGNLSDRQLDRPFPDEAFRDVFPSIRHALTQVLVGHTAMHIGQLTVWRRAMGMPRMSRSFE
jgi:hypothetical protein